MSWRCTGRTNTELITNLYTNGLLKSRTLMAAMLATDRAHFCPNSPYADAPQRIGYDATISAPHMHAYALQSLLPHITGRRSDDDRAAATEGEPKAGVRVLDVGCGSGYLLGVIGRLLPTDGKIVGVEHIPQLTDLTVANLRRSPETAAMLDSGRIVAVTADGRDGFEPDAPYDAIHVGAAAESWRVVDRLVAQLKNGGRLFVPVHDTDADADADADAAQWIWVIDKDDNGRVSRRKSHGVMYVPLTDRKEFV